MHYTGCLLHQLQRPVKLAEAHSRLCQVLGRHSQYQYSDITNTMVATSSSSSEQQPTATLRDLQHILAAVRREQSDSSSLNVPPATPGSPQGAGQWELWQRPTDTDTAVDTDAIDENTAVQESGDSTSSVLETQSRSNSTGIVTSISSSGATRGSFWQSALGKALQGDLPQPPLQPHYHAANATATTTAATTIAATETDNSDGRSEEGDLQLLDVIETQSFEPAATTDAAAFATDTGLTEEPEQHDGRSVQQDMYAAAGDIIEQPYDADSEVVAEVKQMHSICGKSSSMSKQKSGATVTASVFEVQPTVINVGVLCAGKAYVTEVRLTIKSNTPYTV
jgi:hypothetical protein